MSERRGKEDMKKNKKREEKKAWEISKGKRGRERDLCMKKRKCEKRNEEER